MRYIVSSTTPTPHKNMIVNGIENMTNGIAANTFDLCCSCLTLYRCPIESYYDVESNAHTLSS